MDLVIDTDGLEPNETYEAFIQFNHNTPVPQAIWLDISLTVDDAEGVGDGGAILPGDFSISGIYPNPFNARSTVDFSLDRTASIELALYDLNGRLIEVLAQGSLSVGTHQAVISADNLSSGIYIVRLTDGTRSLHSKVTLLR